MSESYALDLSETLTLSDQSLEKKGTTTYVQFSDSVTPTEAPAEFFTNKDYKVTVNNVEVEYGNLHIIEKANSLNSFEAEIYGVTQGDANVAENNILRVYIGSTVIFKGTITHCEFNTDGYVYVQGYDQAIKLLRRTTASMSAARKTYTNTATNTIVSDICSGVINVATNSDTSLLTTRAEYDSRLGWLNGIAKQTNNDWWVDQTGGDVDQFNHGRRGSVPSTFTLTTSGASQNCDVASRDRDVEHIFNSIYVLGYGDGTNQIVGNAAAFTTNYTQLNGAVNKSVTTLTVDDTSLFPASGTVLVGKEKIAYTGKTATTFTGCTRASASTTATAHFDNQYVWDATYSEASPQSGSSVDTYGRIERSFNDPSILSGVTDSSNANYYPEATAQRLAETLLFKYYQPSEIIAFLLYDTRQTLPALGDTVTINDSDLGLSSVATFRCVGRERWIDPETGRDDFTVTVANVPPTIWEDIQATKKSTDSLQQYMQGATNLYVVNASENCDTTYPLQMRFYLPPETTFLNRLKLNFKMKNYRADAQSVSGYPSSSSSFGVWTNGALAYITANAVSGVNTTANCVSGLSFGFNSNVVTTTGTITYTSGTDVDLPASLCTHTGGCGSEISSYYSNIGSMPASSVASWSKESVHNSASWTNNTLVNGITRPTGYAWTTPVWISVPINTAPAGSFNSIIHSLFFSNQSGSNLTLTFTLYRSNNGGSTWTSVNTWSSQAVNSGSFWQTTYRETTDYTGYLYKLEITSGYTTVNSTTYPDLSVLMLTSTTYNTVTDTLNFGIVENTGEFTPPGTVAVAVAPDGGGFTTIGSYSSDQTEIDFTNTIAFAPGNWYVLKFTPTASTYNGRMRIEANLYVQMFLQST